MPLNGNKIHPLSEHAIAELIEMRDLAPIPRCEVNAGVACRLSDEGLIEDVKLPSPFKTDFEKPRTHLAITDDGRARLKELGR